MPYTSSLTGREWEIIEPLLPKKKRTRPPKWSKREIPDGILYQLKNGCNWVDLPRDLPPYSTVFWHYKHWRKEGVFDTIMATLHSQAREKVKKRQWTTLILIDSQAVKNTRNTSVESKGICSYKAQGIKSQMSFDSLGFPFFRHCTKAHLSDDKGLIEILTKHMDYFRKKPMNIPKITILIDHGYHPKTVTHALEKVYPAIMKKIRFEPSAKPSRAEKEAQGKSGFVVVKARWV
ncbi:MAG: IS5 family transposase [Acaryochloridaceae cyanobacterium RL_2_7]|nr:IS5 family transposase [Acaryochloridaceae cyanobacterium RL_2_7]